MTDTEGGPLPGVNVTVAGTSNGATTDFDGKYTLDIQNGDTINYSYIGFQIESIPIHASTMNVALQTDENELDEIVTVGYGTKPKLLSLLNKKPSDDNKETSVYNNTVTAKEEGITNTSFQIIKKHTIKSNEEVTIVEIDNFDMPASYEHYAAPELNQDVFLTATLGSWQQYDLLYGEANIYFEGNYAGKTQIDPQATTDKLVISLGIDPGVVVQRKQFNNFKSKSFMRTTKAVALGYEISIKNNKGVPVHLILEDRIPVTQNKEIKIEDLQVGDATFNSKKGILNWNLKLMSKTVEKKSFSYRVKYPKNQRINL